MVSEAFKQIVETFEQKYRELSTNLTPFELAFLGEVLNLLKEAEKKVIITKYIKRHINHRGIAIIIGGYKLLIPG